MAYTPMTDAEAARGRALYEDCIRAEVGTEENFGKTVIIDIQTGDYAIDDTGFEASRRLWERNPDAKLLGVRIGIPVSFGGSSFRMIRDRSSTGL